MNIRLCRCSHCKRIPSTIVPDSHSKKFEFSFQSVQRVFYEYDGSISKNESGYYFDFQDRRIHYPIEGN